MPKNNYYRGRSFFWPIFLIGVGVVLLLSNLNIIESVNFFFLLQLWPVLLIALGLQILFGRSYPWIGNLLAVLVVLTAIAFMVFAPSLGLEIPSYSGGEFTTSNYEEAIGNAQEADIYLDTNIGDLEVLALPSGSNLIEAEVTTNSDVGFSVSDDDGLKSVSLSTEDLNSFIFGFDNWFENDRFSTIVEISPKIPLSLEVDHGSGTANLDLAGLDLIALDADNGSGSLNVFLPSGSYPASLDTGSGTLRIETEDGIVFDLEADVGSGRIILDLSEEVSGYLDLSSGSGSITIHLPESLGVRITGSTGSGNIYVPSSFIKIHGADSIGPNEDGTWESANYQMADYKIELDISIGSGNLNIEID